MRRAIVLMLAVLGLGCGCGNSPAREEAADPQALVLRTGDLPRGYEYGDDSFCGTPSASEGGWKKLDPLFAAERPMSCVMELVWVWQGTPRYSRAVTSAAYRFRDADGARRGFDANTELASWTASLDAKRRQSFELGDEAELLHGRGLNSPASGAVWRHGNVVAVVVVEPADDEAARELAEKQQERLEHPSAAPASPQELENDVALQLDDPSTQLPVYWLGRTFDPQGSLPPLQLDVANVGGNGPGQTIQLWYGIGGGVNDTVSLDTWEPDVWRRFLRTRLGRLIWDSPCARKKVIGVRGGRAEIFLGYSDPNPVQPPCPNRRRDAVVAHVYYDEVIVAVNLPYCYTCARPTPGRNPYNTVGGVETVIRSLRLRG